MPLPKSHKTERILQLGGSPLAKREGKLDLKQITNCSHASFFQLPISLSFESHPLRPVSQEVCLVSPFLLLSTLSLIAKCLPSMSMLLSSFQGSVTLSALIPSCFPDCPSPSLMQSQQRCSSVINYIITSLPSLTYHFFFP